jgi:tripartite-type tricarboxylate transporter receptor subunit TctC
VPFAPGGTTDILARILAEHVQAEFGQPMLIDVRPGAGGTLGAAQVAQAAPDGATLVLGTPGTHATAPALYPGLPYDPVRDFAPVMLVANVPNVVIVNPALPIRSVAELVAAARARPGSLNYGSAGTGATTHLSGELFRLMTGAEIVHVPYRGSGAALIDLQGGQIQLMFENLPGRSSTSGKAGFARSPSPRRVARKPCRNCRLSRKPACPATRWSPGSRSSLRPPRRHRCWRG